MCTQCCGGLRNTLKYSKVTKVIHGNPENRAALRRASLSRLTTVGAVNFGIFVVLAKETMSRRRERARRRFEMIPGSPDSPVHT